MAAFLAPDFAPYLSALLLDELEASAHTVIGLRLDLTIGYRNGAWSRFAADNGAPELEGWSGPSITALFAPPIRSFYEALFSEVQQTGEPKTHDYECSSPQSYRMFRLRVLPLSGGALLLQHHLTVEQPHTRTVRTPSEDIYRSDHGIITQCCHCRCTRRAMQPETWDWVPVYLDRTLEGISHGLCGLCFRHYYPQLVAARERSQGQR